MAFAQPGSAEPESLSAPGEGGAICLFVASSDNTKDVFRQVSRSFERYWPDCPFPRYVGLNSRDASLESNGFRQLYAPVAGWRKELLHQLGELPPSFSHLLLFLDDFFLLSPVRQERLAALLAEARDEGLSYLRLRRARRPLWVSWYHALLARSANARHFEQLAERYPYYSSLQLVLWKRAHLEEMLRSSDGDIWSFELQKPRGERHFAITSPAPVEYLHVVEKGCWLPYAAKLFARAGLPFRQGKRPLLSRRWQFASWLSLLKFSIFGFALLRMRLRRDSRRLRRRVADDLEEARLSRPLSVQNDSQLEEGSGLAVSRLTTAVGVGISVVIPARDSAAQVLRLLRSLEGQTLVPGEVVIIDSSRERSIEELVVAWRGGIPLVYRHVPFAYPGHARNLGVALAGGRWIAFLDCRTIPASGWLERCAQVASLQGAEYVAVCRTSHADSFFQGLLLAATYGNSAVPSLAGSLVSKPIFLSSGGFVPWVRAGEDILWMKELERRCSRIAKVETPLLRYEGFPSTLGAAVAKWYQFTLANASIDVLNVQKGVYAILLLAVFTLFIYRWNAIFAHWDAQNAVFLPNVTKIYLLCLLAGYLLYRGVIRPLNRKLPLSHLLPWRWLAIASVGCCLDLAKAPGLILGAFVLVRKKMKLLRSPGSGKLS